MKNYLIGLLVTGLAVLGTFYYKDSRTPVLRGFPIETTAAENSTGEPPLYLFFFFSRNNCHTCMDAIQVLNRLSSPFAVTGIVPGDELSREEELRKTVGAMFKLIPYDNAHRRFNPNYSPSLFGVSSDGRVLFILPGVPGQKEYLNHFLVQLYGRSLELLIPPEEIAGR